MRDLGDDGGDPLAQGRARDDGVPSGERGAPEGDAFRVDAVGEGRLREKYLSCFEVFFVEILSTFATKRRRRENPKKLKVEKKTSRTPFSP